MTQEEIRQRRIELEAKIQELRRQIDHVKVDLNHLRTFCSHPDMTHGSCMGESSGHCPDCGLSW